MQESCSSLSLLYLWYSIPHGGRYWSIEAFSVSSDVHFLISPYERCRYAVGLYVVNSLLVFIYGAILVSYIPVALV
jgi:hypothetical protein